MRSIGLGWVRSGPFGIAGVRVGLDWFVWVRVGSCGFVWVEVGSVGFSRNDGDASSTFLIISTVDFKNLEFRQYLEDFHPCTMDSIR